MTRLLLCASEHGRGHVARLTVVADALRRLGHDVSTTWEHPGKWPRAELGVQLWNAARSGAVDVPQVAQTIANRVEAWRRALASSPVDIVVSDPDPEPLAAAASLGKRAVLVSNFTWTDLVFTWGLPGLEPVLREAYRPTTLALAPPGSLPLAGVVRVKPVPHVAAPGGHTSRAPGELPRALVALGFGDPPSLPSLPAGFEWWLPTDAQVDRSSFTGHRVVACPDVAGAVREADVVVCKPGYGIVSQCIAARTPMAFVVRPNSAEDRHVSTDLVGKGVACMLADLALVVRQPARLDRMRAAYSDAEWARCDPAAVAKAVLAE